MKSPSVKAEETASYKRPLNPTDAHAQTVLRHESKDGLLRDGSSIGKLRAAKDVFAELAWGKHHGHWLSSHRAGVRNAVPHACFHEAVDGILDLNDVDRHLARLPDSQYDGGVGIEHLQFLGAAMDLSFSITSPCRTFTVAGKKSEKTVELFFKNAHWFKTREEYDAEKVDANKNQLLLYTFTLDSGLTGGGRARPGPVPDSVRPLQESMRDFVDSFGAPIPFSGFKGHTLNFARAKKLFSDLKNGTMGVLRHLLISTEGMDPSWMSRVDAMLDANATADIKRVVAVTVIEGWSGCAKTTGLAQFMKQNYKRMRYVAPTTNLRDAMKTDAGIPSAENWRFATWEQALFKSASVLIVDEARKLPRGYVDLIVACDPDIEAVILLYDSCQGEFDYDDPQMLSQVLSDEADYWRDFTDFYLFYTFRTFKKACRLWNVPCFSKVEGYIKTRSLPNKKQPLISASRGEVLTTTTNGGTGLTASVSQGLTFAKNPSQIELSRSMLMKASKGVIHVALTRSKVGLVFINAARSQVQQFLPMCPMINALLTNQACDARLVFADELQGKTLFEKPPTREQLRPFIDRTVFFDAQQKRSQRFSHRFGRGVAPLKVLNFMGYSRFNVLREAVDMDAPLTVYRESPETDSMEKRIETSFVASERRYIDRVCPRPFVVNPNIPSAAFDEPEMPTRLPAVDSTSYINALLPVRDPQELEKMHLGEFSQQFVHKTECRSEYISDPRTLAPNHSSKDETLIPLSKAKRLRFCKGNDKFTDNDHIAADDLFHALLGANGMPSEKLAFDELLWEDCHSLNNFMQYITKPRAVMSNNSARSDPHWQYRYYRIFSKTQQKVNENVVNAVNGAINGGDWKACQTLILAHDLIIISFGGVVKYIEAIESRYADDKMFVLSGKTVEDMEYFCKKNIDPNNKNHMVGDFTAMDQSEGPPVAKMEALYMGHMNIPREHINWYVDLKLTTRCKYGHLKCMRHTGEPGTYRFNTNFTKAVYFLRFGVGPGTVRMYSGDDFYAQGKFKEWPGWGAWCALYLPELVFKCFYVDYPDMTGYYISHRGICRIPVTLLVKTIIAQAKGTMNDVLTSYCQDCAYGTRLGDGIYETVPPVWIDAWVAVTGILWRSADRLRRLMMMGRPIEEWLFDQACAVFKYNKNDLHRIPKDMMKWMARRVFGCANKERQFKSLAQNSAHLKYHVSSHGFSAPKSGYLDGQCRPFGSSAAGPERGTQRRATNDGVRSATADLRRKQWITGKRPVNGSDSDGPGDRADDRRRHWELLLNGGVQAGAAHCQRQGQKGGGSLLQGGDQECRSGLLGQTRGRPISDGGVRVLGSGELYARHGLQRRNPLAWFTGFVDRWRDGAAGSFGGASTVGRGDPTGAEGAAGFRRDAEALLRALQRPLDEREDPAVH